MERYGIVVVVVIFYFTVAFHFEYTPDDTYIYLQYARNLASGDGFSFNGGTPSYGVTGPLWVLIVSAGTLGGLDPYVVAKILDLVFASLALLVLYVLATAVLRNRIFALATAAIFSFDAWFLRWSASGMETSAAVLLSLAAVLYVFRNEYLIASVVCGFLTLLRPEGAILFAVIQIDNFLNTTDPVPARRVFFRSVFLFSVIVLPWLAFSFISFGSFVPNTFGAKTSGGFGIAGTVYVLFSELKILGGTQGVVGVVLLGGFAVSLKRIGWKKMRLEVFPLFWVLSLLFFYVLFNVQVVSRYLLLILPFVILYGVWGFKQILEGWQADPSKAKMALGLLLAASIAQSQFVYRLSVLPHMQGFVSGMNECLKPIAYKLQEVSDPHAKVLTPDIGLLGYISGRELYDTAGLITPALKKAFLGAGYEQGMAERRYESVLNPDYIVDRSETKERLASHMVVPIMTKEFPSLGILKEAPVFYTLYQVKR